jgi:hypothetical protein
LAVGALTPHQPIEGQSTVTGSPAETFAVLWSALHDVMGSAATATLLRRAARHAVARAPELGGFEVHRVRFEYRYVVPPAWSHEALGALMSELRPLLVELTGPVVLRRLHGIPELESCGHFSPPQGETQGEPEVAT